LEEFPAGEENKIRKNSCLRIGTLTDSKGFCEKRNIQENSRLHHGKIFSARKSLVSDIPAGGRERDWDFFAVYLSPELTSLTK
jgi:hypothetical protein